MKPLSILLALAAGALWAQHDYTAKVTPQLKGYAYENYPMPDNILVYDLEKNRTALRVDRLTLIQLWGVCCGTDLANWDQFQEVSRKYAGKGLQTISVNFENGVSGRAQRENLKQFFAVARKPEQLYYDPLGYVVDFLKTPGFPTLYLVEADGTVVFRTNGKDPEGLSILESEIQRRLEP